MAPPKKRLKKENGESTHKDVAEPTEEERERNTKYTHEHVLLPYRAVGSVVGAVPPSVFSAGKDSFAVCALGRYVFIQSKTPPTITSTDPTDTEHSTNITSRNCS